MRISVLGMGRMGQALAGRLLDGGHDVKVWNRTPGKAGELVERGAVEVVDIAAAVSDAEIVLTSLANDDAVRKVACGAGGICELLGPDSVYVDSSTVSPALARELGETFPRFVAMPVLGSPAVVDAGEATFLLGGEPDNVASVVPLFPVLSDKSIRYDSAALALAAKLTVNLLLLAGVAALAESFAVGRAGGLSDGQLRELLAGSPMVAPGVRNRFEGVLTGDQEPWWTATLGAKDAGLAIEVAQGGGIELTVARSVRELYERLAHEVGDVDIADVGGIYRS